MAGRVGSDADTRDCVGSMVVDSFDHGECGQVVGLGKKCCMLFGGRMGILDANHILHKPFVDRFCRVCHEHSASEICFREHVWEGGSMVEMKTDDVRLAFSDSGGDVNDHSGEVWLCTSVGYLMCLDSVRGVSSKRSEGKLSNYLYSIDFCVHAVGHSKDPKYELTEEIMRKGEQ